MIGREETAVRIRGALLVGTPPSSGTQVSQAFLGRGDSPYMHLTSQELWNQDEAFQYAHRAIGGAFEEWQRDDALRTDGRARRFMFQAFETGSGIDQAQLVATQTDALIGVVNGSEEPFISLDYLDSLVWANLWEGHCHRLSGFGHAPFWEAPELFEALLIRYVYSRVSLESQ
ncbi:unnamed protein product [Clonostachys solani]|uniref:Alpha/beta hydrolase n=1 Tax=Clonostachys solani TaxID=160281 RepID=A0A9N9ZFC5_9HYPO|nr:unnamed protein product [Clonostachys solani]